MDDWRMAMHIKDSLMEVWHERVSWNMCTSVLASIVLIVIMRADMMYEVTLVLRMVLCLVYVINVAVGFGCRDACSKIHNKLDELNDMSNEAVVAHFTTEGRTPEENLQRYIRLLTLRTFLKNAWVIPVFPTICFLLLR